jgi:hypothetical protein
MIILDLKIYKQKTRVRIVIDIKIYCTQKARVRILRHDSLRPKNTCIHIHRKQESEY